MRLLYIVDARSPIAINWIKYFIERGDEVHVISSTLGAETSLPGLASLHTIPLAFSGLNTPGESVQPPVTGQTGFGNSPTSSRLGWLRNGPAAQVVMDLRYLLASVDVRRHVARARALIRKIEPQLVHAMRIPFEGILAALAAEQTPLLTSVWGNDFTLFAQRYPPIASLTRQTLKRTDALHCDCRRDLEIAPQWDFDSRKPSVVLPGAGGIDVNIFRPRAPDTDLLASLGVPEKAAVVINPRGFRRYVRTDTFFQAIPLVKKLNPNAFFLCSAMAGNAIAQGWVERLKIGNAVRLLPAMPHSQMAKSYQASLITLSLSQHDGTPNTLLEAMACGCFPVVGDIESVREWIVDGENGLLCDPTNPETVARAISRALTDEPLRHRARELNLRLISQRAEYRSSMAAAADFYAKVVGNTP